jgi:hypothetical protein
MSIRVKSQEAVNTIVEIKDGFTQVSSKSSKAIDSKINDYIQVLEKQKSHGQLPKVAYIPSKFSLTCSSICQRINCFSYCRFFNRETTNIYITAQQDGSVFVSRPRSIAGLDSSDNELTNTSFFIHLYDRFSDHLPYIFPVALTTLPEAIKTFWETWNPNSTEELERGKAKRLLKVLDEAEEVYKEIRKEIMKKELLEKTGLTCSRLSLSKSYSAEPIRKEAQTATQQTFFLQPEELMAARVESMEPQCCTSSPNVFVQSAQEQFELVAEEKQRLDYYVRSAEDLMQPALQENFYQRVEPSSEQEHIAIASAEQSLEVSSSAIISSMRLTLDPDKKYVNKKGVYFEFSKIKLIKDLLTVSKCSKSTAQQIADEIETSIEHEVTTQQLWNRCLQLLQEKNVQIKQLARSKLGDELADIYHRMDLSDVDDIPKEDFLALMEAKKTKTSLQLCMKSTKRKTIDKPRSIPEETVTSRISEV